MVSINSPISSVCGSQRSPRRDRCYKNGKEEGSSGPVELMAQEDRRVGMQETRLQGDGISESLFSISVMARSLAYRN